MKLQIIKFKQSVRFLNYEQSYVESSTHKTDIDLDTKTNFINLKSEKDEIIVPMENVLWFKKKVITNETM